MPEPNSNFVAISAGGVAGVHGHSIALKSDGTIVGWGDNTFGQGVAPYPNTNFVAITAGGYFNLGLKADGSIKGWGRNSFGETTPPYPNSEFGILRYGVRPASGSWTGGYEVVISGTNLCDGTDVTNVTLCGIAVADIVSQSSTQLVVQVAENPVGAVRGDVIIYSTSFGMTTKSNAFTYEKEPQAITFTNPGAQITTNHTGLSATASSGLAVSFGVVSGKAELSGQTNLTYSGAGTVVVRAMQTGDNKWMAAGNVTQSFVVARAEQAALTFAPVSPQHFGATNGLSVSDGSGTGTVSYAVTGGPGLIVGETNLVAQAGTGIITVWQPNLGTPSTTKRLLQGRWPVCRWLRPSISRLLPIS